MQFPSWPGIGTVSLSVVFGLSATTGMLERLSIGLRTLPASPTPWPARVGTFPEGGAQEPDDHQHGQADALEVVFLQGRETDAESRDDEEEAADG
jgi:hypothetical protein